MYGVSRGGILISEGLEIDRVAELLQQLEVFQGTTDSEDQLTWNGSSKKIFTVRSAYSLYTGNSQEGSNWPWKQIWKVNVPFKVNCFVWLVARKSCLIQENLMRRGIPLSSRCYLCKVETESNSHLFLHCRITMQLWH